MLRFVLDRVLPSLALTLLVFSALAQERPAQQAFKGIELYSWQDDGGWLFRLLIGTNRLKIEAEIKELGTPIVGTAALEESFRSLAKREYVFWNHRDLEGLAYPDHETVGAVVAAARRAQVELDLPEELARPAQGRLVFEILDAPSLRGNLLGDTAKREVLIYLPPGYDQEPSRRYPVVYLLHGYGAGPRSWLGEDGYEDMDLTVVLDDLIGSGAVRPLIVAMPDARTRLGGSWYADSPTAGDWERFLADDLVGFVDSKYRTQPSRDSRGIAGQSMGGYGALRIAMHRPEVFGAVLGMSAPNLANPDPFGAPAHEAALAMDGTSVDAAPLLGRLMWSKAVAFSPDEQASPFAAELPFERTPEGIVRREAVWQRWMQSCLVRQVPAYAPRLEDVQIRLEAGDRDPARSEILAFADALAEHGVRFSLEIFDGGHVQGVRSRFEGPVFRFFDQGFPR